MPVLWHKPMVVISIEAKIKDYLQDRKTGKVVEGSISLSYAKLTKELPSIESTVVSELRA